MTNEMSLVDLTRGNFTSNLAVLQADIDISSSSNVAHP